jgi:hypothetical protein
LLSGRDPSSFHRQDQQILRLPTAAARPHLDGSSSTARSNLDVPFKKKSYVKINNAYTAKDSWSKDTEKYKEIKQRPVKKILRGLQYPIQQSKFASEPAILATKKKSSSDRKSAATCSLFLDEPEAPTQAINTSTSDRSSSQNR